MLLKSHITNIKIHSDAWFAARLAKFTSSEIHHLMGEKPFTQGALSYIYRKVGEELSGLPCGDEVDTNATRHGNLYEPEAIQKFGQQEGIKFVVSQKLIHDPETRFSCTPDALIINKESIDESAFNVNTLEVKCPSSYDAYIGLCLCETPFDLLKVNKAYFFQVLDQMDNCGALNGFFVCYQPYFKVGQLKIIRFRLMEKVGDIYPLIKELDLLRQRKQMAVEKFNEVRAKLLNPNATHIV